MGELSGLDDKAVTLLGDTFSLRIPVGKLHNDRYVPIGPELVRLIRLAMLWTPDTQPEVVAFAADGTQTFHWSPPDRTA